MILSMTGYGRASVSTERLKLTVDIKSLNSKQLDLFVRLPQAFKADELEIRGLIAKRLERGKVEVNVMADRLEGTAPVQFNFELLEIYKKEISEMASRLRIAEPEDWYATLLRLPDVLKSETTEADNSETEALESAVADALDALDEFRIAEGRKLYDFFVEKISNIENLLSKIDPFEQQRVVRIKERLEDQLSRLSTVEYDRGRLEQELIFYIEKLDVTEEKTRLRSHLNYFLETMGDPQGRVDSKGQGTKLGFIAQEMGREINTLGSKSNEADMQKLVVMMKDELEQIKEQVLNVL